MNKVLVIIDVTFLDESYTIFIPVNKKVGTIKNYLIESISEMTGQKLSNNMQMYEKYTCEILNNKDFIKDSGIINGSHLFLL